MEKIKKLCSESFFISFINYIINLKAVRLFFDFEYISFVWKNSFFYKSLFFYVIKFFNFLSIKGFKFKISHIFLIIFLLIFSEISFLYSFCFGIIFFYIISSIIKNDKDLKNFFSYIYIFSVALCFYYIFRFDFKNCGLLIILFPFSFIFSTEFNKGIRKYIYLLFIFILYINILALIGSKALIIAFITEMVIITITNIKYIPLLIFLIPLGLKSFINNIESTLYAATSYGNFLNNLILLSQKIWNNGFGINRRKIEEIFYIKENHGILKDMGYLIMIIFIFYVLRIARSSFTSLFSADKKYKKLFSAGLAFLIGFSVLSFLEESFFSPQIMFVYWIILGVLKAVRRMNFTMPSLDKTSAL